MYVCQEYVLARNNKDIFKFLKIQNQLRLCGNSEKVQGLINVKIAKETEHVPE